MRAFDLVCHRRPLLIAWGPTPTRTRARAVALARIEKQNVATGPCRHVLTLSRCCARRIEKQNVAAGPRLALSRRGPTRPLLSGACAPRKQYHRCPTGGALNDIVLRRATMPATFRPRSKSAKMISGFE